MRRVSLSLLYGYTPQPHTAIYVGYGDQWLEELRAPTVVLAGAVLLLDSTVVHAGSNQAPACGPGEGTATEVRFGLQLCDGPAVTRVITGDEPHRGARVVFADAKQVAAIGGIIPGDIVYQVVGRRVESGKAAAAEARDVRIVLINIYRNEAPFLIRIWADGTP